MARRIDQRFTSAEEVRNAFDQACQQLGATRALPSAAGLGALSLAAQSGMGEAPYGREKHTVGADPKQEVATLQRTGDVPSPSSAFSPQDYDAPTTAVGASQIAGRGHTEQAPVNRPPRPSGARQRRSPWVAIVGGLTVAVLLTMAGIIVFGLQLFSTASIHFSPRTQLVSQIFQIKAEPFQKHVDPGTQSIPARALSSRKTGSRTGQTTGEECIIFTCHQRVSSSDVDTLSAQVKQTLIARITQDLQKQAQAADATVVGSVQFADLAETADPPVGSISKTVTVTLTEQGSLEYFVNGDAKTLARQLLLRQMQTFGAHYRVVEHPGIEIGRPVVAGVSGRGVVRINIAAGGYIEYQFPGSQLLYMQNHVKGMTVKNARVFIASQVGVDPKTVSIGFISAGKNTAPKDTDTLPAGTQQIKIIPADPAAVSAALPPVQLPRVTPNSTT